MSKSKMQKFTVKDFQQMFPDDDACLDYIRQQKFPERIDCPSCKKNALFHKISERKSYACDYCGFQIAPAAGTIFHKSSTPLTLWFYVIYLMAQTRGGISAKQIERETGVTYKTAWRMCKEIRHALNEDGGVFGGDVELDEAYFGGRRKGKRGRGAAGKSVVFGMVERQGKVEARVLPHSGQSVILPVVEERVSKSASVFTDEFRAYRQLQTMGYQHQFIPHTEKVYVMGNIHTNTIEGFWSNVKNGIRGVYHGVSAKYLQSYLNEYSFRYNHRKDITPMFWSFLKRSVFHRAS